MLIALHWLGGSARVWAGVGEVLSERGVQCIALDLPGFGDANGTAGFDVRAMTEAMIETVRVLRHGTEDRPWLLGGHSMGGKVAAAVARAALDGAAGLENLRGVVLVSPSPAGPEPMEESKREDMLASLGASTGSVARDRKHAEEFIDDNTGKLALPDAVRETAIEDVLRMNRTAFRAWLEHGSKEDWSERIGVLPVPAMIFAGTEDKALGPEVQRDKTLPHFSSGEVISMDAAGHLALLERPFEVAEHIGEFLQQLGVEMEAENARPSERFTALIASDRTAAQTRAVMETRLDATARWNHSPAALTREELRTLRALVARVAPAAGFDIAACIDDALASGKGDGWRFATLPDDVAAWKQGLLSLDVAALREWGVRFVALHGVQQDELLQKARKGDLGKGLLGTLDVGEGADAYGASEMKQWFEDVRAECAKHYVAHPAVMERVGFTGFADEGGFTQIRLGEREEFER